MGGGTPNPFNLALALTDTLQIDVVQPPTTADPTGRFNITLYTGAGNFSYSSPSQEVAGTTIIPLSAFAGLTAAAAADIDGLVVGSSASGFGIGSTTKGNGFIISEIRFGDPSTGAVVPEPASIALWSILGIVGLAIGARRWRRR